MPVTPRRRAEARGRSEHHSRYRPRTDCHWDEPRPSSLPPGWVPPDNAAASAALPAATA